MTQQTGRLAIIGGGLIGCSWAALALAHGWRVTVQDPAPGLAARLADVLSQAWPDLVALGQASGPLPDTVQVTDRVDEAVSGSDFIIECGPDRIEVKQAILAEIEQSAGTDVVIASSTSSLLASDIQAAARHPGRVLVGHPFNPPHLIPLVELVAGRQTSDAAMARARAVFTGMGRVLIAPQKEVIGHIANRLSAALYREAVHLVAEGIATVADVDRAVAFGPGLRWALMGPHLTYHMGDGAGGFRHYIQHLGPTQAARWAELGQPVLDATTVEALISGVDAELSGIDAETLAERRDRALVALLRIKAETGFGG